MVCNENNVECIQKYVNLDISFPTLKIDCVETFLKRRECYNIRKRCTNIEVLNQQCGYFKYSVHVDGTFFKQPCGNHVPATELDYILGRYVGIRLVNGVQVYAIIEDVSYSPIGNLILEVSTEYNFAVNRSEFDTLTFYPNSSYGFVNHCGFLATQTPMDVLPGHKLFLVDREYEIHDVFVDSITEAGIHIKPCLLTPSPAKCQVPNTLPYSSIDSGYFIVISPFLKMTDAPYTPECVPHGFQRKYLISNMNAHFKNVLNHYVKKIECWANTTCSTELDSRIYMCSAPLGVFSCIANQQYFIGHVQDIYTVCGAGDYNVLMTTPLINFPVETGELYVMVGTIFSNNPDKSLTIVDEKNKKNVNYTVLPLPETMICNLSRLIPCNYFRDSELLYNDSFVSSVRIEFITIVTVLGGESTEFVVEGLNPMCADGGVAPPVDLALLQQQAMIRQYNQYNCGTCPKPSFA